MKNTMKIIITNLDLIDITNDRTGEVRTYTRVGYLINKEKTERSKGYANLQSYCVSTAFSDLEPYLLKSVDCSYMTVVDKNRIKVKLLQIGNVVLS